MNGPISFRLGRNSISRMLRRDMDEPESDAIPTDEPRLLVVEPDRLDQAWINILLRKAGFEAAHRHFIESLAELQPRLSSRSYSHVLVDTAVVDTDAKELLAEIRTSWPDVAVIFLSARRSLEEATALIGAGADDYIVKEEQEGRTFRQILVHSAERRRAHRRLTYALQHDHTSGLPNWTLFAKRWASKLREARESNAEVGLLVLRLENFGRVVATLGSAQAQELIAVTGEHLEQVVGRRSSAHLGGERFVACFTGLESGPSPEGVLATLRATLAFHAKGVPVVLRGGLALNSIAGPDVDALLAAAHEAVDEAERLGSEVLCFDASMSALSARRRELELGLRDALDQDEMTLHYQPKIDLRSGTVIGTEALMRWNRNGEMIGPGEFIPILERTGLIDEFGIWALREACLQEARWRAAGVQLGSVAVNLSGRQFRGNDLVSVVSAALEEGGTPPQNLQLELTESSLVGDVEAAVDTMERLKQLGVKLGLDDFGTGYSSMAYLQRFPFDVLKVDRSFVMHLGTTRVAETIAEGIIALGRALGMYVVAEGVETIEQLNVLQRIGCDAGQGYLFNRPVPAQKLTGYQWSAR